MPSSRDWLIATLMGEANGQPPEAQQAILDVIANRQSMPGYGRGDNSVQSVVTENNGKGRYQFDTWRQNDNSYARAQRALQGPGSVQGAEINQYQQAAKVVDDFMQNGVGRGISQGATFYQAPYAKNKWQEDRFYSLNGAKGDNYITVGGHRFTGENFMKDAAAYQTKYPEYSQGQFKYLPLAGSDNVGSAFPNDLLTPNGTLKQAQGVIETSPYDIRWGGNVSNDTTSPNWNSASVNGQFGDITPSQILDWNGNRHQGDPNSLDPRGPGGFGDGYPVGDALGVGSHGAEDLSRIIGLARAQFGTSGATKAPSYNDYAAIAALYGQDVGRSPDADGLNYWARDLQNGKSLMDVDQGIRNSAESKAYLNLPSTDAPTYNPISGVGAMRPADIVNTAYNAVLQRSPDAAGSDYFSQQLQNGSSLAGIMDAMMQSPEYAQTYGAPQTTPTLGPIGTQTGQPPRLSQYAGTINDVFTQLLQRPADADAVNYFDQQITANGMDLPALQAAVKASPEYLNMHPEEVQTIGPDGLTPTQGPRLSQYRDTVNNAFSAYLHRPADAAALDYYSQELQNGTPQSIMEAQLLGSDEAKALGPDTYASLVNNYTQANGVNPTEAATLGPLATQFASVLGRGPDAPTLQYWDSQIDAGKSQQQLLAEMLAAPETQTHTGDAGYQKAVAAFGSQYGVNPADYLGGMLVGGGGETGFGNTPAANTLGPIGGGNPTSSFKGFDPSAYLLANPDVAGSSWASNPLGHYETYGYNEGRSLGNGLGPLGAGFDPTAYFNANPDVKAAGLDPLGHYLTNGAKEGRTAAFSPNVGPYAFGQFSQTSMPSAAPTTNYSAVGDLAARESGGVGSQGTDGYLAGEINRLNNNVWNSAAVERMLAGPDGTPMPVFAQNQYAAGAAPQTAVNQGIYLNDVNTKLAGMAPAAPAPASLAVGMPNTQVTGVRTGTAGLPY